MNSDNVFSNPVRYSLECDWFKDRHSCRKAWNEMRKCPLSPEYIRKLLECSGSLNEEVTVSFRNYLNNHKKLRKLII
ncbi:MAG: hypothetical protein JW982_00390 [Spirochaetes bacterium]|nr:hypothetical protein [Spirochaetota bacterium]